MAVTRMEQETTVNFLPNEDTMIYSANPAHIRKLRTKIGEGKATLVREDLDSITVLVPSGKYDPIRGFKSTRKLSDEQRAQISERMSKLHAKAR
jgi:hypothetical protein